MAKKLSLHILLFPLLFVLSACFDNSLSLQVRYADVMGLKQNDAVYFKENVVGKVEKVTYSQQGDYLVAIRLEADFKNAATVDSRFFIENDLKNPKNKVVTIIQEKTGGRVLAQGEIVDGSIRSGLLDQMLTTLNRTAVAAQAGLLQTVREVERSLAETSQKLDHHLSDALNHLSEKLQAFDDKARAIPNSQEVKQLEQAIRQFSEEFAKTHEAARERIRKDILPQLQRDIDHLRRQLQKEGRDKELEGIDRDVKEMVRI